MQDDWEFCSCDLVANNQLLRLLGCGSGSSLLTAPSAIRSRMLFGRFALTCHLHEGAKLLGAELPRSSWPPKGFSRGTFISGVGGLNG